MDFSKCDETRREHGVLMRCAGNRGHDGEHVWTPAELRVRYESIFGGDAAKALDEILAELNDDPRDRRYSKEQVKRAFWKMLGDMLDDFAEEMFSLVDNSFHKNVVFVGCQFQGIRRRAGTATASCGNGVRALRAAHWHCER